MTMKKFICFYFIILLLPVSFSAQSTKKLLERADTALAHKNYYEAAQYLREVIKRDSTLPEYIFQYAEALRQNYQLTEAAYWYTKLNSLNGTKKFPELPFRIASTYKNMGRYTDAKKYYLEFEKRNKKIKTNKITKMLAKAKQEILACDLSIKLVNNPLQISVERLDSTINSDLSEYAPFDADSLFYFSSIKSEGISKIYEAKKQENVFFDSKLTDTLMNENNKNNTGFCLNEDGILRLISRCKPLDNGNYRCEIFASSRVNGIWLSWEKLPEHINLPGSNTSHPTIGKFNNEMYLFFSSDRKGGFGGQDIWYCKLNKDGSYGIPINAGPKINSIEDEITPYFDHEIQELFFSSTWHKGLGGFDVFSSAIKENEFLEVKNVGYPINSSYNDVYFTIAKKKDKAYLSSNRVNAYSSFEAGCCNDIFRFNLPKKQDSLIIEEQEEINHENALIETEVNEVDSLELSLKKLKTLLPLTLYFHNDEPNPKTTLTQTTINYKDTYLKYKNLENKYKNEFSKNLKGEEQEKIIDYFPSILEIVIQMMQALTFMKKKLVN